MTLIINQMNAEHKSDFKILVTQQFSRYVWMLMSDIWLKLPRGFSLLNTIFDKKAAKNLTFMGFDPER